MSPATTIKTLLVAAHKEGELVALVLRGDHQLNAIKAEKLAGVASPLRMASEEEARAACGAGFGSLGPVGLKLATHHRSQRRLHGGLHLRRQPG